MGGPHFTKKANRLGRDDARKNLMSTASVSPHSTSGLRKRDRLDDDVTDLRDT